jgi:hypothetical protein
VKIFKGVENEIEALEEQVNAWIRETGATIISITGNISPQSGGTDAKSVGLTQSHFAASDVLLVVLYETPES